VVAEIASELAAGIGDARGPKTRLRIEPDARGFDISSGHDDRAAKNFHFLLRLAVDVGDSIGDSVFIHKNVFRQRIGAEFEILGSFGKRQETPGRREKGAGVACGGAGSAIMARRMTGAIHGELRDAIMQIGNANFFRAFLQDVVEATEVKRGQILAIGDCSAGSGQS
jgi:hypothetical protein